MTRTFLGTTIATDLFSKIERFRGREKRSTFVEYLLKLGLKEHTRRLGEDHNERSR